MAGEIEIPLDSGGTLCCGPGETFEWGGYVRICDGDGNEILYWTAEEFAEDPEQVIGAVFAAAAKSLHDLTEDRVLVDGVWEFKP